MRALIVTGVAPIGLGLVFCLAAVSPSAHDVTEAALTGAWHRGGTHATEVAALAPPALPLAARPSAPESPLFPAAAPMAPARLDMTGVREAIAFYRKGDLTGGDDFARTVTDPIARATLEWLAVRLDPRAAGYERLTRFATDHPDWPATAWLRRQSEESLWADKRPDALVRARFAGAPPETLFGRLSLARVAQRAGDSAGAATLVRAVWRQADISRFTEAAILREFPDALTRADHKFRADRLAYKEQGVNALRAAALAGPDVVALVKARLAVSADAASDALIAAVPKPLQSDPGLLLARIHKARKADKVQDAAAMMLAAPRDAAALVGGDEWWTERRLLARKLLDQGDAKTAFRVCAEHTAISAPARIEAEFHAGWIALRFLGDPKLAAPHFAAAAAIAETPMSLSRALYWQGRAAESDHDTPAADAFFRRAAVHSATFYGQLAGAKVGRTDVALRSPSGVPHGDARSLATRVVEALYGLGERDLATGLAMEGARAYTDAGEMAALTDVVSANRDATATLAVGKAAGQRNISIDDAAFPTFGIPTFEPLDRSADLPIVYSIARQESAFDDKVVSPAGAKGLMQLIGSTARETARKAGLDFDEDRLLSDAAFNARIGAAHLGALLDEQDGSYILTFAAYNAGARRVKEWIEAYGDPRRPDVDPVDWIERIPFTETRNYVQRIMENIQVYRARLGQRATLLIDADMHRHGKRS